MEKAPAYNSILMTSKTRRTVEAIEIMALLAADAAFRGKVRRGKMPDQQPPEITELLARLRAAFPLALIHLSRPIGSFTGGAWYVDVLPEGLPLTIIWQLGIGFVLSDSCNPSFIKSTRLPLRAVIVSTVDEVMGHLRKPE